MGEYAVIAVPQLFKVPQLLFAAVARELARIAKAWSAEFDVWLDRAPEPQKIQTVHLIEGRVDS